MTITISDTDPRSIRAVELAGDAAQWIKATRKSDQRTVYGIESQRNPGLYHLADATMCTCGDFRHRGVACKHILAVRLFTTLVRAEANKARRAHLSIIAGVIPARLIERED